MEKKTNKKKFLFILISLIIVIAVIVIAYIGYKVNYRMKQEQLLTKEIELIQELDLLQDDYDISTKTSGDYSYIEKNIKTYFKDLSDNVKAIYAYLNDENLIKILSASNLENDGPEFVNSFQTLTTTRENTDTAMNNIIELCTEEGIKNYVDKNKLDNYYYNLYLDIMYTQDDLSVLNGTRDEIQEIKDNLNIFLDKVESVLNMLKNNKDSWYIQDGQLYFETNNLVNQYNNLYNDLNTFVTEKFSKYKNPDNGI